MESLQPAGSKTRRAKHGEMIEVWPPRKFLPEGDAIFRDLEDPDGRVRVKALQSLSRIENPGGETWQALEKALSDNDDKVRAEAVLCAAELNYSGCVGKLKELCMDPVLRVRVHAVGALGTMTAEDGVGAVEETLHDEAPEVRKAAVIAIAEIMGKRSTHLIHEVLKDDDPEVRWAAAAALGDIESVESADILSELLDDADPDVRFEAAYSLARLRDMRGFEILVANVNDRKKGYLACEILGKTGDPRAIDPLQGVVSRLLGNPITKLRAAASLVMLGVEDGRTYVASRCAGRRLHVRQAAQALMDEILSWESEKNT